MVNAGLSATCFISAVLSSAVVPRAELGSLFLEVLAIAAASIAFSLQLERRDRRVFLLTLREKIRREAMAAHNRGLLAQVQTDALTGVANRRGFDVRLAKGWSDGLAAIAPLGLIMLDIDHFKKFNDVYGHQGGDDCLRRVAAAMRGQIRAGDLLARYGGEEFCVVMPGATLAAAAQVAERIRAAVADLRLPHAGVGADAVVTVSLGAASLVPSNPGGARQLIERADHHLYVAKRAGRNRVSDGSAGGQHEGDGAVGLGRDQTAGQHGATASEADVETAQ
jgi:diguanylate cyclase (GGDEF)-like protein